MTIEQRVAVLEEIFSKLQDYYMSGFSGEEIDALLASAGVPIGITKEYDSVSAMNDDFSGTDVTRGQFVLILPSDTSSEDYGKVYIKSTSNWVYVFTLTALTAIKGPQGPAGKRGAKGADGADGKNFMVLGYYETLFALNAAVPSPGTGDTYGVGTEPPYAFYMYDPTISNWRYVGNLQGPEGPVGGSSNFVRYDAAQTLTAAQQTQARGNINAAPGGFGYGEYQAFKKWDDNDGSQFESYLDSLIDGTNKIIRLTELADYPSNILSGKAGWADVSIDNAGNILVEWCGPTDVVAGTVIGIQKAYKKRLIDGTWLPWEYANPPMQIGVEYRITERYLGKPVYVKVVNCGQISDGKEIEHGISNMDTCIMAQGLMSGLALPRVLSHDLSNEWSAYISQVYRTKIRFECGTSVVGNNIAAILKYTKTTD